MPGHVLPLMALSGGVMMRLGRAEGAVDLMWAAGMRPCGALCTVLREDGDAARLGELREFAVTHDIPILFVKDLVSYRLTNELLVQRVADVDFPIDSGGAARRWSSAARLQAASIWRWSRATWAAGGRRWCGSIRNA